MSAELAMSILALAFALSAFLVVLTLFFTERRRYASRADLEKLRDYVTGELGRMGHSQSELYRYAEAIDAQGGGRGHQVLYRRVYRNHPEA